MTHRFIVSVFIILVFACRVWAGSSADPVFDAMKKWVLDHPAESPADALIEWAKAHPKDILHTDNGDPVNPEQDMVFLVNHPEYDPSQKVCYFVIKMWFETGHRDYALRAARKLSELKPKKGKPFEMVGFLLMMDGKMADAIQPLKTAYALGDRESVVLLSEALLFQGKPIDEYVDVLQRLKLVDIDAYKPLLASIEDFKSTSERKAFLDKVLDGADFGGLVENKDIYTLLLRVYALLGDENGIKKIEAYRAKADAAIVQKGQIYFKTSSDGGQPRGSGQSNGVRPLDASF